ncbi:MAG: hypothetical protein II885_08420 [Oscillospiraceae bacterium]|nr:hypothetical protein [Oscillospiraceae bacterium]
MGRSERGFYHALAALLFAALCAWGAAALWLRLDKAPAGSAPPAPSAAPAGGRFRGVLLRQEEALEAGAFSGFGAGARLSAAETGTESALFFPASDGWEFLSPADFERLTPEKLEALLREASAPELCERPRLVYGFTLCCAALFDGETPPAPGACTLTLDGLGEARARLLSVTEDALGRRVLRLRLTAFPQALYELRVVEGEIG